MPDLTAVPGATNFEFDRRDLRHVRKPEYSTVL